MSILVGLGTMGSEARVAEDVNFWEGSLGIFMFALIF